MEDSSPIKNVMRENKDYVSVSTRLPNIDAVKLMLTCKRENKTPSEYIRDLIIKNFHSPKKSFLSGKNKIQYDKTTNSFKWFVELDSGEETEILNNLSDNFLKNLNEEIEEAIKDRNHWVHQTKIGSVDIPEEMIGGEE